MLQLAYTIGFLLRFQSLSFFYLWCQTLSLAHVRSRAREWSGARLKKRGPGNHCLRVGGFKSKFVSKTLCILSINLLYYGHPRGWLINYYQEREIAITTRMRITDLTEMASNKCLEASAESRSVLAHHSTTIIILTNLLRYLDPQGSWGKWRMRKQCIPGRLSSIESGLESRLTCRHLLA